MTDTQALIERLTHCSQNTKDEYLHELTGRAATALTDAEAKLALAREALEGVLPYVMTQAVGCHGDKCREPWCYSCNEEDDAYRAADTAKVAMKTARACLAELGEG